MSDMLASPDTLEKGAHNYPHKPTDFPFMIIAFSKMLFRGLAQTASSIHADLQQIDAQTDIMEKKTDQSVARFNQNSARIQEFQDHLESAMSKFDDLENRSRCYNFRI